MPSITKIVITGGPCGGKSTALSRIERHFSNLGYHVLFVGEAATEMITSRVVPWLGKNTDFQYALLKMQRSKEHIYHEWASRLDSDKVLMVCDRGALDNKAYMSENEFHAIMESMNTNEIELRDNYDAVFHLVTAANGAAKFYTTENNNARTETVEEAIELDNKIIAAWTGHPHLRVIDNSTSFEAKIGRLLGEITGFLGVPEPMEIERKFLIKYPDLDMLDNLPNCTNVDIIQTYLISNQADAITRIRQRGRDGHYVFTETTKRHISDTIRVETEKRISQAEYLVLLMNADTELKQIRKIRYCLSHNSQYFEIDIYPFWDKQAILEVELSDENQAIDFPAFIDIIREVTSDTRYANHSLAQDIPKESE